MDHLEIENKLRLLKNNWKLINNKIQINLKFSNFNNNLKGLLLMLLGQLSFAINDTIVKYSVKITENDFSTLNIISVPDFLIATILVLVFAVFLGWLPSIVYLRGNESGWVLMKTIAMPLLTLVILVSSQIIRMTRATVLNVMSSPYVEMAILKGVPRRRIILRHALFNAIGPIVNVIALNLAWLVGGVVVVEQIFSYPGLAKLMIEAVQMRDMPLVQACAMIFCAVYVVLIFIADMATILSNPRLRHPK